MTALRLCCTAALLLLAALPLRAEEGILVPKRDGTRIVRPDKALREGKGRRSARSEALEERSEALDERLGMRDQARRDAIEARRRKPSLLAVHAFVGVDATFLSGWTRKGREPRPGRVDWVEDLSLPSLAPAPVGEVDVVLRRRSGAFLAASYRSLSRTHAVGGEGFTFHGRTFAPGERLAALFEMVTGEGGVYYAFSDTPGARLRAELGASYLHTLLTLSDLDGATDRVAESCDAFTAFLGLRGRFRLSSSVTFAPRIGLGLLWFGDASYGQTNFSLDVHLALAFPLGAWGDLELGYRVGYRRPWREEEGLVEETRMVFHGLSAGLRLRMP